MTATEKQETCQERINKHYRSRFDHFELLTTDPYGMDEDELADLRKELHEQYGGDLADIPEDESNLQEWQQERLAELPLGTWTHRVLRIDLSWGGPADWIEVELDDDGTWVSAQYHFSDWFDHAETSVSNDHLAVLEAAYRIE
tara:strand:+ start:305 stop:733 length:429 start_codon:yes stop_codon:yes gene_type:complete